MTIYPNINIKNEPETLKTKTKDDQSKVSKYRTEKHDYENLIKSPKIDNQYYRKKYESLNKNNFINDHRNYDFIGIGNR